MARPFKELGATIFCLVCGKPRYVSPINLKRKKARFCSTHCRYSYRRPIMERLWEKISPEPNSGCWLWEGGTSNEGYGVVMLTPEKGVKKPIRASRLIYLELVGDVAPGLCVLHRCDTPACVNPDHLFLGTQTENIHDMARKGRGRKPAAFYRVQTSLMRPSRTPIARTNAG